MDKSIVEPKNSIFDLVLELHMLKWSTFDNKVKELVETVLSEKHWINPVEKSLEKNKMFTYPVEKNELHISNENSIYHLEYNNK